MSRNRKEDWNTVYEGLQYYKNLLYQQRPDLWLKDRFGEDPTLLFWDSVDPEAYKNHKWDGDVNPFWKAMKQISDKDPRKKWVGIESATSCGKTYWLARMIYWFLDVFEGSTIITTAPTKQQLENVLWGEIRKGFGKFKKIRPKAELYNLKIWPNGKEILDEDDADLNGKWVAYGKTASSSAGDESSVHFQGIHADHLLIVVEEAAGIHPSIITALASTATGDNNHIVCVGNPDNVTDPLHEFCGYLTTLPIRISALDHPNIVRNKSDIKGAITQNSIDFRADEYGVDSHFYKSRVRGIAPKDNVDSLIKYDWIVSCCVHKSEYSDYPEIPVDLGSNNALGVDVANSDNGDKASLTWGQNNILKEVHEFYCRNAMHLAYNVIHDDLWLQANDKEVYETKKLSDFGVDAEHVGVDAVGVGASTVNAFHDSYYQVIPLHGGQWKECIPIDYEDKMLYEFNSLRSQMYWQLAMDLQNRDFMIEIHDPHVLNQIIKELTAPKLLVNGNKIAVEPKDSIIKTLGYSPNKMDSIVYWNWMRKDRTQGFGDSVGFA